MQDRSRKLDSKVLSGGSEGVSLLHSTGGRLPAPGDCPAKWPLPPSCWSGPRALRSPPHTAATEGNINSDLCYKKAWPQLGPHLLPAAPSLPSRPSSMAPAGGSRVGGVMTLSPGTGKPLPRNPRETDLIDPATFPRQLFQSSLSAWRLHAHKCACLAPGRLACLEYTGRQVWPSTARCIRRPSSQGHSRLGSRHWQCTGSVPSGCHAALPHGEGCSRPCHRSPACRQLPLASGQPCHFLGLAVPAGPDPVRLPVPS